MSPSPLGHGLTAQLDSWPGHISGSNAGATLAGPMTFCRRWAANLFLMNMTSPGGHNQEESPTPPHHCPSYAALLETGLCLPLVQSWSPYWFRRTRCNY